MRKQFLDRVVIMYPSGNPTAVVFDDVSGLDLAKLNTQICNAWQKMFPNSPQIEQCCYLTKPSSPKCLTKVVLFGGEFSGNTTRCAVKLLYKNKAPKGLIEVSGAKYPLKYMVNGDEITVAMPIPKYSCATKISQNTVVVRLDGIAHYVVLQNSNNGGVSPDEFLQKIKQTQNGKDEIETQAIGVVYFNQFTSKAMFLIWVKSINTLYEETACGSGTCAIGVAMSYINQANTSLDVIQPSGETINVKTKFNKNSKTITSSNISGKVDILYDGMLNL